MKPARIIVMALTAALILVLIKAILGEDFPSNVPKHRIGVRVVNGVGEFYVRATGQQFIPRGNNYIRLAEKTVNGEKTVYHSTFDPGAYDQARAGAALAKMHQDGYNVVRVFLNNEALGTPTGGLSQPYMANLAAFVKLAAQYQVYPIITQDWVPGGKYGAVLNTECCALFADSNLLYLSRAGMKAYSLYYTDFINALIDLGAPTDAIFSYELANELYYVNNQPPFSLQSGKVLAVNYKSYDMASPTAKEDMIAATMPYWINGVRGAIRQVDPTALVSVGFMRAHQPSANDPDQRISVAAPAIWSSMADFIDLHTYKLPSTPGGANAALGQLVNEFGTAGMQEKPIIMGEFSAGKIVPLKDASVILMVWQIASCEYGFDGWLLWTWDLDEVTNYLWSALDGDDSINKLLAPVNRPDACSLGL